MNIKAVHSEKAPHAIGPYSQAIIANGFIFCSGQVGRVPGTKTIAEDVVEQTHQVMKNLIEVLTAAGSDINHVVKTTIFLSNIGDFAKVNEAYAQYFSQNKPARSTVQIAKLPQGDLLISPLVEIDAIAVLP
jgi:2-iminobutanoate/2-iminopropanoate deaminase